MTEGSKCQHGTEQLGKAGCLSTQASFGMRDRRSTTLKLTGVVGDKEISVVSFRIGSFYFRAKETTDISI